MTSVLLRLEGPMQAWSTQMKLGIRDTDREPSKSGVLGLVGSALGMDRDDAATLAEMRQLRMAVREDRAGVLLRDYHTAGGGTFRGRAYLVAGTRDCVPSHRFYLADASFTVALSGDATLVDSIAEALRRPRWPLFLGRRACVPSVPPCLGVAGDDAAVAVRRAPLAERADDPPWRLIVEAAPGQGEARYDVPLSFVEGERQYGLRYVQCQWLQEAEEEPAHA